MNPYETPASEEKAPRPPRARWSCLCTLCFALIGGSAGGSVVFYFGFRAAHPPPPPPGTAACGNPILVGYLMMVIGTPLAAILSALIAAILGALLDCILHFVRRP